MDIPSATDKRWKDAILADKDFSLKFLATKIILGRLKLRCSQSGSPGEVDNAAGELHAFFEKNQHLPDAMSDVKELLGG
jgi:hypothetical protein